MDSDIVTMIQILKLDELQLKEYLDLGEYKKVCSVTKLQLHQTRNFLDMDVEVSDDEHDYEDLFYIHPEAIDKRNGTETKRASCISYQQHIHDLKHDHNYNHSPNL